uniref:Ig-like domain-containing protein n=1 Tax=Naja naja TaxID=35670 RepID=A0A8C6VPK6_NAJNA
MGWAVIFLALLTYCTGTDGQSSWTQPPSSSVSLGGTVTISCITQSSYPIGWHQQKAGQGPRFVHCDGCSRGEGIPNRFTATRSGSTGYLAITNAQVEDEADYYCGSWNSAVTQLHSGKFLWGSVTKTFILPLE